MGKSIAAGFVKGYTGRQLDLIDQRRKEDAEAKKLEMLERLRRDTAEWEENLPSKKASTDASVAQAERARQGMALDQDKHEFDKKHKERELSLAERQESRLGRLTDAQARHYDKLDGSGVLGENPESLAIQQILTANKPLFDSLTTVPEGSPEDPILDKNRAYGVLSGIVQNSQTAAEAEKHFREYLDSINRQEQTRRRNEPVAQLPKK